MDTSTNRLSESLMVAEETSAQASIGPLETGDFEDHASTARLTPIQLSLAGHRRAVLAAALPHLRAGIPQKHVATAVGVSPATMSRLLRLAGEGDPADLCARILSWPLDRLAPGVSTGRRSDFDHVLKLTTCTERLIQLYVSTIGASSEYMAAGRHTGSMALALRRFADFPECPPELADALRTGAMPRPLVSFLRRHVTPEVEAKLRGPKHYSNAGPTGRRDMTVIEADGTTSTLLAGDLWELDDMSSNQPFYVQTPTGFILTRQTLCCRDVKSRRWLALEKVARPREAYRAEDVLRFLRRLMELYGKPRIGVRLERGVWAAKAIKGTRIDQEESVEEEWQRAGMPEDQAAMLQDGLQAIGIRVQYVHTSHLKGGIESAFRYLQAVSATFTPNLQNIGRHAGEFERAATQLRRARNGVAEPGRLGFADMGTAGDLEHDAMTWINGQVFAALGISPDACWTGDTAAHPLATLTRTDLAAFLPAYRERQLQGGAIYPQVDGTTYAFRAQWFAKLSEGYSMGIKFDPCEPTLGAAIYNLETSSANHGGFQVGQFVGWAEFDPAGPQIDLREVREGSALLKAQKREHATMFRATPRPGQPTVRIASARDGRGNVAQVNGRPQLPAVSRRSESSDPCDVSDMEALRSNTPRNARVMVSDDDLRAATGFERDEQLQDAASEVLALFEETEIGDHHAGDH